MPSDDELKEAFKAFDDGTRKFSRRRAILMADFLDVKVKWMIKRLEYIGCLKRGSWDWFVENGGFTQEHYDITRADRARGIYTAA